MSLRDVLAAGAAICPPAWLPASIVYETVMGSEAYGVSTDSSDVDVYGICMPPKRLVFPHLAGEILGFGRQLERFECWQEHHVAAGGRVWDFQMFGIVKFFQSAMDNIPNVLEALFTPPRCVLTTTAIAEYLRQHRTDFLHKGAWHKFKGYAHSQKSRMRTKLPTGKRAAPRRGARLRRQAGLSRRAPAHRGRANPDRARPRPRTVA
jgi:predicted nucleotidyltransferase